MKFLFLDFELRFAILPLQRFNWPGAWLCKVDGLLGCIISPSRNRFEEVIAVEVMRRLVLVPLADAEV